jgi:RNHCP domain
MSTQFIKNKENFVCGKCNIEVFGDGYTNHCHECLWSRHVDVNPGDRAEDCRGLMEPIAVEKKNGEYSILHKCTKCGFERVNKAQKQDSFDMLIQVSAENSKKFLES